MCTRTRTSNFAGRPLSASRLSHTPSPLGLNDSSRPNPKALAGIIKDGSGSLNGGSGIGSGSGPHMSDDSAMLRVRGVLCMRICVSHPS